MLDDRELNAKHLRAAIIKGENSGEPTPFNLRAFIASKLKSSPPKAGFPPSRE
jgi:Bacterial antitoxin of ParD toxin-antitoxin type II system and RHH